MIHKQTREKTTVTVDRKEQISPQAESGSDVWTLIPPMAPTESLGAASPKRTAPPGFQITI
jgi:hypothetical protein